MRHYSFTTTAKADNNPQFALQFLASGLSSDKQCGHVDNIVVSGVRIGAPGAGRVTIFSDGFEKEFPGGWARHGNLPQNASWFDGAPKVGTHCVRLAGSPVTGDDDWDCYLDRVVSTAGFRNIHVSFSLGAAGLADTAEVGAVWAEQGSGSPHGTWHWMKSIKGKDPENNGSLHHFSFSLSEKASNNPHFLLQFLIRGANDAKQCGYLDDIVVTGERIVAPPPTAAREYWVSPSGDDAAAGSKERPFATLERARNAVREAKQAGLPKGGNTVWLRGGVYELRKTFELNENDSGAPEAPVVYRAASGEDVRFAGGKPLPPGAFEPVRDAAILSRLPAESRGKVLQADLKALGIADFGVMRPRGQGRPTVNPALELFVNDQPMQLARWPNRGMVARGKVLDKGGAPRYEDFSDRGGTFTFDFDRPARWTQAGDLWLSGYFARGYANDTIDVKSIDLAKRTITLARAHRYGLETVGPTQAYFALNLLEEIDEPGEWYLDRRTGLLYLWPPSDLSTAKIAVSLLDAPMVAMEGVSHVALRGLTFEASRGMGVYIEQGQGNLIAGCTFRNLGTVAVVLGQGIKIDPAGLILYELQNGADRGELVNYEPASRTLGSAGYADPTRNRLAGTGHGIVGCDIYGTGAGGIVLGGGDRKTLTPGGNYVLNCRIHHVGRLDGRTPAISIDGVGNRVAHGLLHDIPICAVMFDGNDHVIELNEIRDVCLPPVHDMGAIYTGRDPGARGNVIRHNLLHHIGNPEAATYGVYLDDGACGVNVIGNVFFKVQGERAVHSWGHDHVIRNNVFVDTRASIHPAMDNRNWPAHIGSPLQVLRLRKRMDILQPPHITRYPELARLFEKDPNYPRRSVVHHNISVRSGEFGAGHDRQGNWVTGEDPGFVDAAGGNFQFKPDAPVWTKAPGFQRIPLERIGLYTDEYRKATAHGPPSKTSEISFGVRRFIAFRAFSGAARRTDAHPKTDQRTGVVAQKAAMNRRTPKGRLFSG
jgi:hypothetical protein